MQRFSLECFPMATYKPPSDGNPPEPDDVHPALDPSITTVPVTPGISTDGGSSYVQTNSQSNRVGTPNWNTSSYFAPSPSDLQGTQSSPAEVAKGARTGAELLRRLSLIDIAKAEEVDVDPRTVHPGLHLSGNVISANFTIPYNVELRFGGDWVRGTRFAAYNYH
jgi:trehalose 6-phosphate synthase/phosphatase